MTSRKNRIYYDVTATIESGLNTGIQKVVIQLAENMNRIAPQYDFEFIPIFYNSKRNQLHKFDLKGSRDARSSRENDSSNGESLIEKLTIFLRGFYYFASFIPGVKRAREIIQRKTSKFYTEVEPFISVEPIELSEFDFLVTADAFWNVDGFKSFLVDPLQCPSKIVLFIHDIIPISNPEFFEIPALEKFKKSFESVLEKSVLNFTSSKFVREELLRYFPESEPALVTGLDIGAVPKNYLPSNLKNRQRPVILMVGTLEPRKNYDLILDWFKTTSLDLELVIVGRRGWNTSKTVKKMRRMQKDGYLITWLGQVSDERLEAEYTRCQIGICASQIEGFGLPLREFIARNRIAVASNIPAFSEMRDSQNVVYFDLREEFNLEASIQKALGLEFKAQFKQDSTWPEITHTWMKEISKISSDI